MSEKIGQILIRKGKITHVQLREALRTQQFFGGYLGSHLSNLGFIDEATLGETLSEIYSVPCATGASFRQTRPEVLSSIPAPVAQHFRVVPIEIEDERIHLAMLNPRDGAAIEEVSTLTGKTVAPFVAPEFRILHALDKHYAIRRERRRVAFAVSPAEDLGPLAASHGGTARGAGEPARAQPPVQAASAAPPVAEGAATAPRAAEGPLPKPEPASRLVRRRPAREPITLLPPAPEAAPADEGAAAFPELDPLIDTISMAASRNDVLREVLAFLKSRYRRAAAFVVQGNEAVVWGASEPGRRVEIPLQKASVLSAGFDSMDVTVGPPPDTRESRAFYALLGGGAPPSRLLVPVVLRGRVVAIFYADDDTGPIGGSERALWRKLSRGCTFALEILILREKIRAT